MSEKKRTRAAMEAIEELSERGEMNDGVYVTLCDALKRAHQTTDREVQQETTRAVVWRERIELRRQLLEDRREALDRIARARREREIVDEVQSVAFRSTSRGERMARMAIAARDV